MNTENTENKKRKQNSEKTSFKFLFCNTEFKYKI